MPDGTIVLMGGLGNDGFRNDTWKSTDKGRTWTLVNGSSGWPARVLHSGVVMPDGTIVLIGGSTRVDEYSDDVWQSRDQGASWVCVNKSIGWMPRMGAIAVVSGGSIIVSGGTLHGGFVQYNDVWMSADKGLTWTQVTAHAQWTKRYGHSMLAMPDNSILLAGGFGFNTGNFKNDTWRSTDRGATWKLVNADFRLAGKN